MEGLGWPGDLGIAENGLAFHLQFPLLTCYDAPGRMTVLTHALFGSRVLADQQLNKRTQQRFASPAHVVNQLEETQAERQFCLGNTSVRTQATVRQQPKPFHGVHMPFTKTVAIFISCIFALAPPFEYRMLW
jgi:hypothetical protein